MVALSVSEFQVSGDTHVDVLVPVTALSTC